MGPDTGAALVHYGWWRRWPARRSRLRSRPSTRWQAGTRADGNLSAHQLARTEGDLITSDVNGNTAVSDLDQTATERLNDGASTMALLLAAAGHAHEHGPGGLVGEHRAARPGRRRHHARPGHGQRHRTRSLPIGTAAGIPLTTDGSAVFTAPVNVVGALIQLADACDSKDPTTVSILTGTVDQAATPGAHA